VLLATITTIIRPTWVVQKPDPGRVVVVVIDCGTRRRVVACVE
jgi:hypothetical protein